MIELNKNKVDELQDQGIQQALFSADEREFNWSNKTYDLFKGFLMMQHKGFQCEDFRKYCEEWGHPAPPTNRAYGGVIKKAAKANLITRVGTKKTNNVVAHRSLAAVWMRSELAEPEPTRVFIEGNKGYDNVTIEQLDDRRMKLQVISCGVLQAKCIITAEAFASFIMEMCNEHNSDFLPLVRAKMGWDEETNDKFFEGSEEIKGFFN